MTVLVTADLHFSDNPRDAYRHGFQATLQAIIKKHNPNMLFILGDLTEEKDHHGAKLVNQVVNHIAALGRILPVVILQGNHDYIDIAHPFLEFVRNIPNVFWINTPKASTTYPNWCAHIGDFLFLPHSTNYKRDWHYLGDFTKYNWIFTHNSFDGADMGHGQRASGIPTTAMQGARVISGDIHIPQKFTNITYVGAPYTVDFGDNYEPRLLLVHKDKYESIKVSGPMKRLVEITSIADLKNIKTHDADIVKVRVMLDPAEYDKWPNLKDKINEWAEGRNVWAQTITPKLLQPRVAKRKIIPAVSDKQLLQQYAKAKGVDESTLKTGLVLLEKQ
jgi:predicted phosphodiesterase